MTAEAHTAEAAAAPAAASAAEAPLGWTRGDTIRTAVALAVAAVLLGLATWLTVTSGEGLGGSNASFSLLMGAGLGILFERGRYCFFCIFRDFFEGRNSRGLYAVLTSIVVGMVGYAVVFSVRVPQPTAGEPPSDAHIAPVSLALVIAGLAFGLGMVLSGGCIAGHLYRLPQGHLRSVPALVGVAVGFGLGFLSWDFMYSGFIAGAPVPWLPASSGYVVALVLQLGVIAALGVWLLNWNPKDEARPARTIDGAHIRRSLFFSRWPALATGAGVGVIAVLAYYKDQPLGVTSQISSFTRTQMDELGLLPAFMPGLDERLAGCVAIVVHTITTNGWLITGIVLAALVTALLGRRVNPEKTTVRNSGTAVLGGILLGWGAMIGLGCTIGVLLSGTQAMAVSGWVFGIAVFASAGVGFKLGLHRLANPTAY